MCGIIGVLSNQAVQEHLLRALKNMEYRGYDSAGICIVEGERFHCKKQKGKLNNLTQLLETSPLTGLVGIGHTRWATHGEPTEVNAHPHCSDRIAVVHNGIIENYKILKDELTEAGATFMSQTDSEVIPWLVESLLSQCDKPELAWLKVLSKLHGAYAIAALDRIQPDRIWFARKGSPLLLARNEHAMFVASDALAVAGNAEEVLYLEEGEWGHVTLDGVMVYDANGHAVKTQWQPMPDSVAEAEKGAFEHYMLKEIHEQPEVIAKIIAAYAKDDAIKFSDAEFISNTPLPQRIVMVACGTSYHAALTARYWLERYLQISVEVDVASEYRYRDPVIGPDTWLITLSQSGETADTLEALRLFKRKTPNNKALAICNVPHSSLVRESDGLIELHAGPEIGVASTKAFTAQLTVLALFSLKLSLRANAMSGDDAKGHLHALHQIVGHMISLLSDAKHLDEQLTPLFEGVYGSLYLGRGPCYPLALEGALKLKEISYLHAEGYAAGEMKHGPIALIDSNLPVIVLALKQYHLEKVISNLHEVQARGAKVILLTDMADSDMPDDVDAVVSIPTGDYFTAPLLAAIPLQLLAYYVACSKDTDVDQPRNLAKSVTVE